MTPERFNRLTEVLRKRQNDITVILENVFNPHNISAVMRTCDAVGIQEIFVLNTMQPPVKDWGRRSNTGTAGWLHIRQYDNTKKCIHAVKKKYGSIFTTRLSENSIGLYQMDFTRKLALVFGNEQFGISGQMQKHADGNFIIPQVGVVPSLNISVACAVTLYEAFRQKQAAGHYDQCRLSEQEYKDLQVEWGMVEK